MADCTQSAIEFPAFDRRRMEKIRWFTSFDYQGKSWDKPRRVIARIEVTRERRHRRYILSNFPVMLNPITQEQRNRLSPFYPFSEPVFHEAWFQVSGYDRC